MSYDEDPLLIARETHVGKYQGSPDGLCCLVCELESDPGGHAHVHFPCGVVNHNRCEFEFDAYRCLQTRHEGDRHLVGTDYGTRMVVWEEPE